MASLNYVVLLCRATLSGLIKLYKHFAPFALVTSFIDKHLDFVSKEIVMQFSFALYYKSEHHILQSQKVISILRFFSGPTRYTQRALLTVRIIFPQAWL